MPKTTAEKYYAGTFPDKLFIHTLPESVAIYGTVGVYTNDDPEDLGACVATFNQPDQIAFIKEMARRWNGFPILEQAVMDVREMANNRKSCIRMPNGLMLDNYCTLQLKATFAPKSNG